MNVREDAAAADGVVENEGQMSESARLRSDAVQHVDLSQEKTPAALRRLVQGGAQCVARRRRLCRVAHERLVPVHADLGRHHVRVSRAPATCLQKGSRSEANKLSALSRDDQLDDADALFSMIYGWVSSGLCTHSFCVQGSDSWCGRACCLLCPLSWWCVFTFTLLVNLRMCECCEVRSMCFCIT